MLPTERRLSQGSPSILVLPVHAYNPCIRLKQDAERGWPHLQIEPKEPNGAEFGLMHLYQTMRTDMFSPSSNLEHPPMPYVKAGERDPANAALG